MEFAQYADLGTAKAATESPGNLLAVVAAGSASDRAAPFLNILRRRRYDPPKRKLTLILLLLLILHGRSDKHLRVLHRANQLRHAKKYRAEASHGRQPVKVRGLNSVDGVLRRIDLKRDCDLVVLLLVRQDPRLHIMRLLHLLHSI